MERTNQINLLYDYYGQLLTERQGKIVELYYWNNLSLQEIALQFGVSRQSVHDILKRSEQSLRYFEDKLGLVHNSAIQREKLSKVLG
ncbi:MAG: YlxM family DNA-binding protein, partial [Peptococcaceae bacterium]|nr:YlxM family DNA-binding protein [Peptococcaceae bacterium]